MDFTLSPEQKALRESIRAFAKAELNDDLIARDRDQVFRRDLWKKCGDMMLQGLPVPEAYGGAAADGLTTAIALEALGYGCEDSGLVFAICAHLLSCVVPFWKHGSEEQKRKYLPGLCDGTLVGVHAMTEPDSGSDAYNMRTTATPDGDGWRINGTKTFISNGPEADVIVVFAVTDKAKGFHGGITTFVLEKSTPGFSSRKIEKMGIRTAPFGELFFDNVYVGPDAILGQLGGGGQSFIHTMDWERVCLFAGHVGTMERLVETAVTYARTRQQFGQPIGKFQSLQHIMADMFVAAHQARSMLYFALSALDELARERARSVALARLHIGEAAQLVSRQAIQLHGGYGITDEYAVSHHYRHQLVLEKQYGDIAYSLALAGQLAP